MVEEQLRIGYDKLVQLITDLGIQTEPRDIRSIHIDGATIEVVRYRHDGDHRYVVAGGTIVTETIIIAVSR